MKKRSHLDKPEQPPGLPGDDAISDSMATNLQLARARDFYLTLFEEFPALIWRSGLDAKCNYFNKTWLAFTGRALAQELGDGWIEGVHAEDLARCMQTYLEAFAVRKPFQMEYRIQRFDGMYRWITDIGRPFNDLDGEFAGYIGSCYDITDRINDEQALKESEERYRQLIELSPDIILVVSRERIIFINQAGLKFFGLDRKEQVLGKSVFDLVYPSHPEFARQRFQELESPTLEILRLEETHHFVDHSSINVEVIATPVAFKNQRAVQVIVRDITERKRTEAILHDLAYRDPLTHLYNRKAFQEDFEQRLPKIRETNRQLAVFFMDLDNFKAVNDQYGHDVGDYVLVEVANRLCKIVRAHDTVSRLGGDEFILLSEIDTKADASTIMKRLHDALALPIIFQDIPIYVSASIGISIFPDNDSDSEGLIQKADHAMYIVKHSGKSGYGFYVEP